MSQELASAWQFHKACRFADAARSYHVVLLRQPDHPEALHLFGVLHHQNGYFGRAVELMGRAVALAPRADYYANLAEAYRALGEHQQAIDCCQAALQLQPIYPEVINNLGLALHDLGRYDEAIDQFRSALRLRPTFALTQNNLGTTLREQGRADEAIEAFRAAIQLDTGLAKAHSNLGQMLIDQNEAEEALPHCQEAVRLEPGFAAGHNNLGNAYRALERWPEAYAAYDEALRLSPKLAQVHANRGLALQLEGNCQEAFVFFRRATELAADDAEMWRHLANAHVAEEDYAAALPCWERIVELQPARAGGHSDLGWALQEEGRLTEAAACYRRALELQPNHLDALLNQGGLHEELGEMAQAETSYRKARTAHAWSPAPLSRLATLLRGKLPDSERGFIQTGLQRLGPRAPARGPLLFGLAQVLDAQGDYAGAAECLRQANALALESNQKRGHTYDAAMHSAFVDRLIDNFTSELFQRLAGVGDDTRQPVFVVGMPRSGTTLVEQVLASHSHVHGAGELGLARQVFLSVPKVLGLEDDMQACCKALDAAAVGHLSKRHLDDLRAILDASHPRDGHAERIVDKMPDNYLYLGFLALLFPRATFIHVRRDPRDIAVSCWMTNFRSIRWANDPEDLAGRLRDHHRLTEHWKKVLPVPVHEVVYEQLVDDFETEARRLVTACGLEWEPGCLEFHRTTRPVRTASVTQVRQPLYRQALARWKHYETALADLFAALPTDGEGTTARIASTEPSVSSPTLRVARTEKRGPFVLRNAVSADRSVIRGWIPEILTGTPQAQLTVAVDQATGATVGVGALRLLDNGVGRFRVYVAPAFRRCGCGTSLLDWVRREARGAALTSFRTGIYYESEPMDEARAGELEFFRARGLTVQHELLRYRAPFSAALAILEPLYQRSQRDAGRTRVPRLVTADQVEPHALGEFVVRHVGGFPEHVAARLTGGSNAFGLAQSTVALDDDRIVGAHLVVLRGKCAVIEARAVEVGYRSGWLNLALMYHSTISGIPLGIQSIEFEAGIENETTKLARRLGAAVVARRQAWGCEVSSAAREPEA